MENKKFILRGVVHFINPQSKVLVGHYIVYAWRTEIDRWEQFDDLPPQPRAVRNTSQVPVRLLIQSKSDNSLPNIDSMFFFLYFIRLFFVTF